MGRVGLIAGGQFALVDRPAADGPGAGVQQHLAGVKAVAGAAHRSIDPVAVAAADADTADVHMPVVAAAVRCGVEFNHPRRLCGISVVKQQQLHLGGLRGPDGKVHPIRAGRAAQGPGPADPHRHWLSARMG